MDIIDAIIARLFSRTDCYARACLSKNRPIYLPSYYSDASTPLLQVDRDVIQSHLRAESTVGSYVLNQDRCKFAVIDVDVYEGDPLQVGWAVAQEVRGSLVSLGVPSQSILMEFSGRKGWHVWVLFEELTKASSVRRVLKAAVQGAGFTLAGEATAERSGFGGHLELFPKADDASGAFGNLIKLPFGVHKVTGARSALYDPITGAELPNEALLRALPLALPALYAVAEKCPEVAANQGRPKVQRAQQTPQRLLRVEVDQMCEHVRWMVANPSSLDYEGWKNLGILLSLCEGGDALFHSCSSQDPRYDPAACDDLIRRTRVNGLNPPRCTTLGCNRDCGVKNPLQLQRRAYRRARGRPQQPEEKPIEFCRKELGILLEELLDNPTGINLVLAPCGLGKTTQLLQKAHQRGLRVLTLAPDHGQAPHCLSAYPGVHLKSRGKLDEELDPYWCLNVREIEKLQRRNFSGSYAFCRSCEKANRCPYLRMLQKARAADHVVAVHAHLNKMDPRILSNRDLIVVDEPIWNWYRREERLSAQDVSDCRRAMQLLQSDNEIGEGAQVLTTLFDELLSLSYGDKCVPQGPIDLDKNFMEKWEAHSRQIVKGRNVLPDLINASLHGTPIVRGDGFSYVHVSDLYENMVILDAFGDRGFYEQVTGRNVKLWEPNSMPEQRVKVHQVLDGAYPNASLIPKEDGSRKTVLNEIERIQALHPGVEPAFICTKQFETILREHYPDAEYLHFGNLVGRDDFRDKPLVIRIGYQMLSYEDLVRNARVLFGIQWDDREVVEELRGEQWSPLSYNNSGNGYEVRTKHFDNEYVQMYYENVVLGEMYQGDGRCRPYEGEGHYYIICNLPTQLRVDETIILKDLKPNAEQAVAEAVAKIPCGETFSSTDLNVDYHLRHVRRKLNEMDNVEKRGNRWVRVR